MKSDEGFSDMLDKTILIDCLNENVTHPFRPKNYKTPVVKRFGGFFYLFIAIIFSIITIKFE